MNPWARAVAAVGAGLLTSLAVAGGFIFYPGSSPYRPPDTETNRQWASALRPGTAINAWFTGDTFEQVLGFYRALGREYIPPQAPPAEQLPNGQHVQSAFVIFDGAPDPASSKQWISIRHPFVGSVSVELGVRRYHDVRDVTEIVLTEKHAVPQEEKPKNAPGPAPRR